MKAAKKILCILLVLTMALAMMVVTAGAAGTIAYGAGTVSADILNIRSGPDTTYSVVSTVTADSVVVITRKASSDWYQINYNGTEGYVASCYLENILTAENFNAYGLVTGDGVRYRSSPSTSGSIIGSLFSGSAVNIVGINNGWYKIQYGSNTGYMRSDYINLVSEPATAVCSSSEASELGQEIVNYALQYVGCSYVYGSASPSRGFDCSGLVYYVYGQYGYSLSRTASTQYANNGITVSKSDLQPGDLLFFSSNGYSVTHVGIYIGDGEFVHASTSKTGVITSNLSSDYYTRVWFGAKRVA